WNRRVVALCAVVEAIPTGCLPVVMSRGQEADRRNRGDGTKLRGRSPAGGNPCWRRDCAQGDATGSVMNRKTLSPLDFQAIFQSPPGLYLVLEPDFTIVAASNAYLRATMTRREEILGRGLFEIFPENPAEPNPDGVSDLRASLSRVLAHREPDRSV